SSDLASVLRTSSTGYDANRMTSGYQRVTLVSCLVRRSPICTSACWMWRGFLSSRRYSLSCLSESWRPNQVFHQNTNGINTISHAVRKNRRRLRVDMRRCGLTVCYGKKAPFDISAEEMG